MLSLQYTQSSEGYLSYLGDTFVQKRVEDLLQRVPQEEVPDNLDSIVQEEVRYFASYITVEQLSGNSFLDKQQGNVIIDADGKILVLALRYSKQIHDCFDMLVVVVDEWRRGSQVVARKFKSYNNSNNGFLPPDNLLYV